METIKSIWCYVCDKDGSLWVVPQPPENIAKIGDQWISKRGAPSKDWYTINRETLKPGRDGILEGFSFKDIPVPKWEDEHPIVIAQHIKTTYYTLD